MRRAIVALALAVWSTGCTDDGAELTRSEDPAEAPACACPLDARIDNLVVCASPTTAFAASHVFSSHRSPGGRSMCEPWRDPQPLPMRPWSEVRISAPCDGTGSLCVTLRAGSATGARAEDCVLTERCVPFAYARASEPVAIAPLAAWVAEDAACIRRYEQEGGYLELRAQSAELGCGDAADSVRRVSVCPARCQSSPSGPGCASCGGPEVLTRF